MGLFHRHHWKTIKATKMVEYTTSYRRDITLLLMHCYACNSTKTKRLDGHWTLDQILGNV